ncbi:MAG: YdhR family protein [Elainellaceae cyanobacterium]
MITAIVQFPLAQALNREQAQAYFLEIAPMFHEVPGLVRKYFLLSEDGQTAGGVYLWQSREDADRFYTEHFKLSIREKFDADPAIAYFESPVVVESWRGETIAA